MFRTTTVEGDPVTVGPTTVIPVARQVALRLGGESFGLWVAYEGPSHVDVVSAEGLRRLRILDVTLLVRLALALVVAAALVVRRRS